MGKITMLKLRFEHFIECKEDSLGESERHVDRQYGRREST